jgi:arylsulfatase A-like enzyme
VNAKSLGHFVKYALQLSAFACLLIFVAGCRDRDSQIRTNAAASGSSATEPALQPSATGPKAKPLVDFLELGEACSTGHRGVLLDYGDRASPTPRPLTVSAQGTLESVEHDGATWLRVTGRGVMVAFPGLPQGARDGKLTLEARVRGASARSAVFVVNGKSVGSMGLAKHTVRMAKFEFESTSLLAHGNSLTIQFHGGQSRSDVAAEIDWVRVGPSDTAGPYAAPIRADVVQGLMIGTERKRSLSLRDDSFVRCSMLPAAGSRFEASISLQGEGEADIDVMASRDRSETQILKSVHVASNESTKPIPISVELPGGEEIIDLALIVQRATKGTRVAIAEPRVVVDGGPPSFQPMPPAKSVVVVIFSSVSRNSLSVYGGPQELPELGALASNSVVFDAHRGSSLLANGSVASMLTGRDPSGHMLTAPTERIPSNTGMLATVLQQAGVQTAMFTANPTTFAAFGFDKGFEEFKTYDPADAQVGAVRAFEDAARWLGTHTATRNFVVIHARAGHPPWDATREELKEMAPASYSGVFDPRRAGEYLAKVRKPRNPAKFTDADRTRMWALYALALKTNDIALGGLIASVRQQGRDDQTAFIVTSDLGLDATAAVPFQEGIVLDESALQLALIVRPAGNKLAARTKAPTVSTDLARTILRAYGLDAPFGLRGVDLWESATGYIEPQGRVRVAAAINEQSFRWGNYVYIANGQAPKRLCNEAIQATCTDDLRASSPIAFRHLSVLSRTTAPANGSEKHETAAIDYATALSLKAWGAGTSAP